MEYGIGNITGLIPKLDIGYAVSLLGDVYGFNSPVYLPYSRKREFEARGYVLPENIKNDAINGYSGIKIIPDEDKFSAQKDKSRYSSFHTIVLGDFWMEGGDHFIFDEYSGKLITKKYSDFEFPIASIVTFTREKNVVKTPILGGHGTVKEIFGFDDWQIQIDGIIFTDASKRDIERGQEAFVTMTEQMNQIQQIDKIAGSIKVTGDVFSFKEITRIVIESISFNPIQGKPKIMPYSIKACSDSDILLTGLV